MVAPSDIVSYRRKNDVNRKRETRIKEIEYHQSLCTNEWESIKRVNPDTTNRMFIVNNINLSDATNEIEKIMHDQAKLLRKIRIDK